MKDKNIGLIGIGSLGKNLANNILLAGYSLYINDLNKKNSKDLINKGAKWCNDLEYLTNKSSVILSRFSCSNFMPTVWCIWKEYNLIRTIVKCFLFSCVWIT